MPSLFNGKVWELIKGVIESPGWRFFEDVLVGADYGVLAADHCCRVLVEVVTSAGRGLVGDAGRHVHCDVVLVEATQVQGLHSVGWYIK